ncbi:hypothetical protein CAPTEDRAFT_209470 [Capitella teleta]|uniref:Uncharacterized protein n=1 Tax=Capitella teleta TaxID=283909 RepID=R7UG87_CAPTE|nr:hypothetical protein CAPTEDRAFT_209470 [Capitella teleta]|eukprot:ELU02307.1 hypothetical protein CAPTEDRAFT_209470 [Capitella teleta]
MADIIEVPDDDSQKTSLYSGNFSLSTYSPDELSGESAKIHHDTFKRKLEKLVLENGKPHEVLVNDFKLMQPLKSMELSEGAMRIRDTANAGGSSIISEFLSYELMHRCFGAKLRKTEMEMNSNGGPMTDYTCDIFGKYLAVSVTRAMAYNKKFTFKDALKLIEKKLENIYSCHFKELGEVATINYLTLQKNYT